MDHLQVTMHRRHRIPQALLRRLYMGLLTMGPRSDLDNVENQCEQPKLAIPVGKERQSAMKADQYASTAKPIASIVHIATSSLPSKISKCIRFTISWKICQISWARSWQSKMVSHRAWTHMVDNWSSCRLSCLLTRENPPGTLEEHLECPIAPQL